MRLDGPGLEVDQAEADLKTVDLPEKSCEER